MSLDAALCRPLILAADSFALLGLDDGDKADLQKRAALVSSDCAYEGYAGRPTAVYIGAANADAPEFFGFFEAIMKSLFGLTTGLHFMKLSDDISLNDVDEILQVARITQLILLSGGDPCRGMRCLRAVPGLVELIQMRTKSGDLTLLGVSAGAMQMCRTIVTTGPLTMEPGLDVLPSPSGFDCVLAHEEREDWPTAREVFGIHFTHSELAVPSSALGLSFGSVVWSSSGANHCWQRRTVRKGGPPVVLFERRQDEGFLRRDFPTDLHPS